MKKTVIRNKNFYEITSLIIVVNSIKNNATANLPIIKQTLINFNINFDICTLNEASSINFQPYDAIVCLGGDGSILSISKYALKFDKPIIGINYGRLGFLTTFSFESFIEELQNLKTGNCSICKRNLLHAKIGNKTYKALNDIVLKSEQSRLISLSLSLSNGTNVTQIRSDGLIFCTCTGSTAYNLSALGPIIHPDSNSWCVTPICPRNHFNRPFVFNIGTKLSVKSEDLLSIIIDGQKESICTIPATVFVAKNEYITFLQPKNFDYFKNLRDKLNW